MICSSVTLPIVLNVANWKSHVTEELDDIVIRIIYVLLFHQKLQTNINVFRL